MVYLIKTILFFTLSLFSFCCQSQWYEKQFDVMGTRAKVEFESDDEKLAKQLIDQVVAEMIRIDWLMSPFKPQSELSKINQQASRHAVEISSELFNLINQSIVYSELTKGAFDITFSSVGYLYDFRHKIKPKNIEKNQLVEFINYKNISMDKKNKRIYFNNKNIKIDLGGIAKGHAVDRSIDILRQHGIRNAFVSAGGDSRVIGKKNDRLWYIGIRHPRQENKLIINLPLEEVAISTSGDYERFFIEEGVRYHHIIDPKTGDSSRKSQSVTILAKKSTVADALSTSIFILGPVEGLKLINKMPDTSAIIIGIDGKLHYSEDLSPVN